MKNNFQRLHDLLLNQQPEKSDAVVWLQGDRYDRAQKILEIYRSGYAKFVIISGNNVLVGLGMRPGENNIGLLEMKNFLVKNGISRKDIIIDDKALNTKDQALNIIKLAKKNIWKKIIIVSSSYHQPRAFLSIVKAMRVIGYDCKVINQSLLNKNSIPVSGRAMTASKLMNNEITKIDNYQLKGDISSYKEAFDYLKKQSVEEKGRIKFRLASINDSDILFKWRNDLETRRWSHNSKKINKKEHLKWLTSSLKNSNRKIFIVEYKKHPVGTIRTDNKKGVTELSWAVAPEARGQGIGKEMVSLFVKSITGHICAEVKVNNKVSKRIAEIAGMKLISEKKKVLYYQK